MCELSHTGLCPHPIVPQNCWGSLLQTSKNERVINTRLEPVRRLRKWVNFCRASRREAGTGSSCPKPRPRRLSRKLNKEINAALADPKMKARLADLGSTPLLGSPGDFGKLIAEETEKWGKVINSAGIKAE